MITFIISPIFVVFRAKDTGRFDKVEVKIPICKNCKKNNTILADSVDLEEYEMTFTVHKNLRKEFEKNTKYLSYK